ncbi:MAG: penicillin-binding protein [Actinophytocola sp.]|nr:penicillin-binding protein [Actinophytocola sp.]
MNGARPPAGPPTRMVRPGPAGPPRPGGPAGLGGPGRPGDIPDGPTEMLPPVHGGRTGPEPELLTHRELDYDEDPYDERELDRERVLTDEDEDGPLTDEQRLKRRKKIWRRVRRTAYVFIALMIIGPMIAFFVAYQMVEVPSPESIKDQQGQSVVLQYADKSEMAKVAPDNGQNRTMVKYKDIPETVLHAVFAAEDAEFMTNPGFDITGVMRAGWNQVTGGEGGGSTITQQYIKKATGNEEKTVTRKALEVVQAYKMNNTYNKEDIITAYLNTIYFGRSAYGISAAAKAYYNKDLKDVSASEAALLAGMIQNPGRYEEQAYLEQRWNYVMDQMVNHGWFPADKRKAEPFPKMQPLDKARPKALTGPRAHIQTAVFDEVEREAGISREELHEKGLVIRTTIDPKAQTMAEKAVRDVMAGQPKNILPALVAVNPKDGSVVAYYGGENGIGIDWAAQPQEPGSSFKPFDLVALLQEGKGLTERYDGTSGRRFEGRESEVRNSGGASCGKECTVAEAMKRSINTVFYDIAVNTVGTNRVAAAAKAAGIESDLNGPKKGPDAAPDGNIAIGGGDTRVSTLEMASAYSTFANGGTYHESHMVSSVVWPDGKTYWQAPDTSKPAFDPDDGQNNHKIARNVTESLEPVVDYSHLECADDRECAGKTGTHQLGLTEDNAKAWMVGYTPQISTAVSMGAEEKKKQMPLKNSEGRIVYGSGLPGQIWMKFMDSYLKGKPVETFGRFDPIGEDFHDAETQTKQSDDKPDGNRDQNRGRGRGNGGGGNGGGQTTTDKPDTGTTDPPDPSETDPTTSDETNPFPPFPGVNGGDAP